MFPSGAHTDMPGTFCWPRECPGFMGGSLSMHEENKTANAPQNSDPSRKQNPRLKEHKHSNTFLQNGKEGPLIQPPHYKVRQIAEF